MRQSSPAPQAPTAPETRPAPPAPALPADELYARNLIGGRWEFPAVGFDYEIRSPRSGAVITTVPLSSRIDVARAITAATAAAPAWAADHAARRELLTALLAEIEACAGPLAELQSLETGLDLADSVAAIGAFTRFFRRSLLANPPPAGTSLPASIDPPAIQPLTAAQPPISAQPSARALASRAAESACNRRPAGGVNAHILAWGMPFAEVTCAVLADLRAGRTAVIKPSLRAPMSATAFALLAIRAGLPPGVINLVQGAGLDVGAALIGATGLASLHVRAGTRTLSQAARATARSGTPLRCLRAGGNIALAGPGADADQVATAVADSQRVHCAGGVLGLPLLCVHADAADDVTTAILARLATCEPAPLPTEPLRNRALAQVAALRRRGATVLSGAEVPDDVRHRMGWIVPPTVLAAGTAPGWLAMSGPLDEPTGPVLAIVTWRSPTELAGVLAHPRYADGIACAWGLDDADLAAARLPHTVIVRERPPITALAGSLPAAWTGAAGTRAR